MTKKAAAQDGPFEMSRYQRRVEKVAEELRLVLGSRTVRARMAASTVVDGECELWVGRTLPDGYGQIKVGPRFLRTHRVAYILRGGRFSPLDEIDHSCHRENCLAEAHLRVASRKQTNENLSGPPTTNTSGYRGVSERSPGKFRAYVTHNRTRRWLGQYATAEEAARVAAEARANLFTYPGRG